MVILAAGFVEKQFGGPASRLVARLRTDESGTAAAAAESARSRGDLACRGGPDRRLVLTTSLDGEMLCGMTTSEIRAPAVNWAGNHTYPAAKLHRPASMAQLQEIVSGAASVHVLGSRHSFNGIADAEELISLEMLHTDEALPAAVVIDPDGGTVSFGGGLKYGELVQRLDDEGLALHNMASLPHISVAGAIATATHGSGVGNGNLATAVAALEMVTSGGDVVRIQRGDPDFDGVVVGLGALGAVTCITLDVEPAFEVRQDVFEGLSWAALLEHFDEIVSCGYSVSVFTVFRETVDMVWVKTRTDSAEQVPGELFGAEPASVDLHPVIGLDPTPCTPQRGRPGPWHDRLPHFRMGFTPSAGEELQSEYLLPRRHAAAALEAVRALADRIRPLLMTCEIRTVASDRLWLSTSYQQDSVAFHFTWVPDQPAVEEVLVALEGALSPFGARPHWGKVFTADAESVPPLYERHADFVRLVERMDPRGAFRNAWLEARVLGRG
jgi:xylitol oxidase